MRDEINPDDAAAEPTPMDRRLHAIDPRPIPEDLLDRCLATVSDADRSTPRTRLPLSRWRVRIAAAAAACLFLSAAMMLGRPRSADAASLLRAVRSAGIKVDASHTIMIMRSPEVVRREETWYARDRGRRQETRLDDRQTAVVIRNRRWEFHWDIAGRLVAAWSTEMNGGRRGPNDPGGIVQNADEMARWASEHRALVQVESDIVGGRTLRKITLTWPGPPSGGFLPRDETVWFEPDSLRPVKHLVAFDDGRTTETLIDYPKPDDVPDDLFAFRPPPDVTIEINDPDLGRQIYSDPRTPDRAGDNP